MVDDVTDSIGNHQASSDGNVQIEDTLGKLEDGCPIIGQQGQPQSLMRHHGQEEERYHFNNDAKDMAGSAIPELGREPLHPEVTILAPKDSRPNKYQPGEEHLHNLIVPPHGHDGHKPEEHIAGEEQQKQNNAHDAQGAHGGCHRPVQI